MSPDSLQVAIVMGSDSDLPVVQETLSTLKEFEVPHVARILSAHRTPEALASFVSEAEEAGVQVFIAAAGAAAHLAGVVASLTPRPVIGLPLRSGAMNGLDALYAMVQMPPGVPVAVVAIDGAKNAALLAVQMLAVAHPRYAEALRRFRRQQADKVLARDARLQELGAEGYLAERK